MGRVLHAPCPPSHSPLMLVTGQYHVYFSVLQSNCGSDAGQYVELSPVGVGMVFLLFYIVFLFFLFFSILFYSILFFFYIVLICDRFLVFVLVVVIFFFFVGLYMYRLYLFCCFFMCFCFCFVL